MPSKAPASWPRRVGCGSVADRSSLRADCAQCFGLCCVVPAFSRSADFAIDKPARTPCPRLADPDAGTPTDDFGCTIHAELRPRGFAGCTTYDCFGAGQQVAQHTYAGVSWREAPQTREQMFTVFEVVRALHELRWLLAEAADLVTPGRLHDDLEAARTSTERLVDEPAHVLEHVDVDAHRARVVPLLRRVSEQARGRLGPDLSGADLAERRFTGTELAGASLRGAVLLGADLRGADLDHADLTGADLRGADVRGARLSGALFLSQPQLDACRGDEATTVPAALTRPGHWEAS